MQSLEAARDQADCDAIYEALNETQGNINAAARGLGISRASMYRLLTQYQIIPRQVVGDYAPTAAYWARRRANPLHCQTCGKPCLHQGVLTSHQRVHQPTQAGRGRHR